MKKAFLPLAAVALALASCEVHDSTQSISYPEYNLIVDIENPDQPAQVSSYVAYQVQYNFTKNVVDLKGSDVVINNQKYSFETDTMALQSRSFAIEGGYTYNLCFSKPGQVKPGSDVKNVNGTIVFSYYPTSSSVLDPNYAVAASERLDLNYIINDRYKVQTFAPTVLYRGQTVSSSDGQSLSTKESDYVAAIDFQKNKASVYVYNAKLSEDQSKNFPKVICFDEIPVKFSHDGYYLESAAPKTTILGIKDNKAALVDSVGFAASNFVLVPTSSDLTEASISYNLDGHYVTFRGCSIVKSGY